MKLTQRVDRWKLHTLFVMSIDISLEDPRWSETAFEDLAQETLAVALVHMGLDPENCEISVLACNDPRISELNAEFRGKTAPTNVLSWPAHDLAPETPGDDPHAPSPDFTGEFALGDIAMSFDTCAREAEDAGKPMADHVRHLMVHGLLHLLGYDHIRDPDATLMERIEAEILGKMGVDDPYYVATSDSRGQLD